MNRFSAMAFAVSAAAFCGGCGYLGSLRPPSTLGEELSGYTYIPTDPITISERPAKSCGPSETAEVLQERDIQRDRYRYAEPDYSQPKSAQPQKTVPVYKRLLESFPDNAVRIAVEQYDASGTVRYGPSSVGARGERFRVTVDYINADTRPYSLKIAKFSRIYGHIPLTKPTHGDNDDVYYLVEDGTSDSASATEAANNPERRSLEEFNVPLYVGIGLRVTADISVLRGNTKIDGLGVIAAEADAGRLSGSLVVQTLGINGKSISAALPIQSELNRTTAQNAIVAIGSIKALLYENETVVSPRVVGLYLPFPAGKPLVNQIISVISKQPVEWYRPCERAVDSAGKEQAVENAPPGKNAKT